MTPTEPETLRYGVIGTGMMGVEHLLDLAHVPGARVTAIADPHSGSIDWARSVLPDPDEVMSFRSHRELVDADCCDVVIIATPNMTHARILEDLIPTDLHLLVEKPLCTTVEDCLRIIAAAESREAIVRVGLEYRYMPPVARLVETVRAGGIGEPRMVAIREHRFPFLRKVGDWNRFTRNTGGTLVEKCCHFFDLMNLIIGEVPVAVLASGGQDLNHLDEIYDGEVPDILDNAFVIVEYSNGARASLDLCMFAEGSRHSEEVSVVGATGKAEAFLPASEFVMGTRAGGREQVRSEIVVDPRITHEGFHHGSSLVQHLELATAVRSAPRTSGGGTAAIRGGSSVGSLAGLGAGLWSVAMGVAAHRSIDQRRRVTLDELLPAGVPSPFE